MRQLSRKFSACTVDRARTLREVGRGGAEEAELGRRELARMQAEDEFRAAPEIDFDKQDAEEGDANTDKAKREALKRGLRIVPASPSYFTARPAFTDDYLHLQTLLRKYATLPTLRPAEAPRIAWRELQAYKSAVDEVIRPSRYKRLVDMLKRMNLIHPDVMPGEVREALDKWARDIQPFRNTANPILIDRFGRAGGVGRRKASSAKAWVVEGDGEIMVNGKALHEAFARLHDRESVVWALKATQRIDKYNVFAIVRGGGTTGQAEALTLAVSKALMAHEPLLKPALRKGALILPIPFLHFFIQNKSRRTG